MVQSTSDGIPTFWIHQDRLLEVLGYLKERSEQPYGMLYDLTCIDERHRDHREGQPPSDFTVVYHLLSFGRNQDLRIKVAAPGAISHPFHHDCIVALRQLV